VHRRGLLAALQMFQPAEATCGAGRASNPHLDPFIPPASLLAALRCAVLCCAFLCCAVLSCAVLCSALLRCALLCSAALCSALLRCAVLCCAVLCCAALLGPPVCCVLYCAVLCCVIGYRSALTLTVCLPSQICTWGGHRPAPDPRGYNVTASIVTSYAWVYFWDDEPAKAQPTVGE
jgi:hypothetical protein